MKKTDLAWAAGIVDGEGSIYARRVVHKKTGYTGVDSRLAVAMTHRATIYTLQRLFGHGTILKEKKHLSYKPSWRWVVTTQRAARVLELLLPYLRTKRKQAIVYLDLLAESRGITSGRVRLPRRRRHWQDIRIARLKRLNHA